MRDENLTAICDRTKETIKPEFQLWLFLRKARVRRFDLMYQQPKPFLQTFITQRNLGLRSAPNRGWSGIWVVLHYSDLSGDYRQAWPTIIAAFIFLVMRNEIKVVSIIKVYDVSLFVWPLALTAAYLEGPQCTHAFSRSVGHINQRTGNLSVKQTAAHLC